MAAEQNSNPLVVKRLSARERISPSDFSTHGEYLNELRSQERQDQIARRILELKSVVNIGGLVARKALELNHAKTRLDEAINDYDDRKEFIRELNEVLEAGGSLTVRPVEGESLVIWAPIRPGYNVGESVAHTMTDSDKFIGTHIIWDQSNNSEGQLQLFGTGIHEENWVNLTVNENSVNFVVDDLVLPQIIVE